MKLYTSLLMTFTLFTIGVSFAQKKIQKKDTGNQIINDQALHPLFVKLSTLKKENKQAVVLQMGDSHMQMGYFAEEMRAQLGQAFGLSAIGNIFPYPIAKYKPFYIKTVVKKGNWEGNNYLSAENDMKYGVTGFTIKTNDAQAILDVIPQQYPRDISTGQEVIVYYSGSIESKLQVQGSNAGLDTDPMISPIESTLNVLDNAALGWKKAKFIFNKPINKIRLEVNQPRGSSPFYVYDIQLLKADQPGIIYHNCGVGGAQFSSLCDHASYSVEQMKDMQPDLIIFSYGSNESYTTAFRYNTYMNMVRSYLDKVKAAMPGTTILLTSPPDTRSKDRYPRNADSIGLAFKQIALEKNYAYWDMRQQMGGDGSLYAWLKKGWAASDKLHFTKEGYTMQAKLLMEAFFKSYNQWSPADQQIQINKP